MGKRELNDITFIFIQVVYTHALVVLLNEDLLVRNGSAAP